MRKEKVSCKKIIKFQNIKNIKNNEKKAKKGTK